MDIQDIYEKALDGQALTIEECAFGANYFQDLATKLGALGPGFRMAWREAHGMFMRLDSELTNASARSITNHSVRIKPSSTNSIDKEIIAIYNNGKDLVGAIKRYRELTGSGLKESKDYIDHLRTLHKLW